MIRFPGSNQGMNKDRSEGEAIPREEDMTPEKRIFEFIDWLEARCQRFDEEFRAIAGTNPHYRERLITERAEAEAILNEARRILIDGL